MVCVFVSISLDNLSTHTPILFIFCTGVATWPGQTSIDFEHVLTKKSEIGGLFVFFLYVLSVNMILTDILITFDGRGFCLELK